MATNSSAIRGFPIVSGRPLDRSQTLNVVGTLVGLEVIVLVGYLTLTGTEVLSPRYTLYPFVWINAAVWVFLRRPRIESTRRRRVAATVIAVAYFGVLAVVSGLVGHGHGALHVSLIGLSPGWGPAVMVESGLIDLVLLPFKVLGYLALALLVYLVALAGLRSVVVGPLGVATCVGCFWPFGAAFFAAIGVTGSPLASASFGLSYDISTALFLVTVGLLYWSVRRMAS